MMKRLVAYFAERSLIVNILSIGLFIAGILFLADTNREAFPKIDYNYVIIVTTYPGSTAADIEKHISISIENEIREVDGIEEIWSSSIESRSVVVVKLDPDIENKDKTINDLKDAVDSVSDFPKEAEDPIVKELTTSMVPVIEISIINKNGIRNDREERKLRKLAKKMEDRLRDLPGVARVDKQGYRDREMAVQVNPDLLEKYHVAMNDIITALSKKNLNFPGGLVKTANGDIMVRTIGEVENTADIGNVLIRANDLGNWVRVKDVATVRDTFEEEKIINKTLGKKSITLTVLKKESADIINLVENITNETVLFEKKHGKIYNINTSNDLSYYVKRRLNVLINNGKWGMLFVIISLLISLGWRISLVTALGIPLAFCGAFIWMGQQGITINLMSMFGLIMVLGMLVDDAIVVAENIYRHLEEGWPVKEAVIEGTGEVIIPVAGTVMTTIAAFAPLMMMSGIMGKFMWTLPAVVSVALVASWFESMFILPSHIYEIEVRRKKNISASKKEKKSIFKSIKETYLKILTPVLKHKYISMMVITVVFTGSIFFAINNIKLVLFPQGKIERFIIKAESDTSTGLTQMNRKLHKLEKIVASLPENELDNYISKVGIIRETPGDPNEKNGSNYAMIIVNLTPEENRTRKADKIIDSLREKSKFLKNEFVKLEFAYVRTGPPVGKAIDISAKGDNFKDLENATDDIKKYLSTVSGVKDIADDYEEGKNELRIFVDEKTASIAGISVYDVASTVRSCFEGTVATKIKKSDEEIDIRVVFPEKIKNNLKSLDRIKISNRAGNLIPLKQIASFKRTSGISTINRKGWKRAIRVTADIDEHAKDVTSVSVNKLLMEKYKTIDDIYPGVTISYEGEFKDTQESVTSLMDSFLVAVLVIYIILVALFRSLLHPLVIMGVIPLTFIGVIWALYFHVLPFSFIAIMGVVGLTGVVVNDSIVLVDFIKRGRAMGLTAMNASLLACGNRIRPVFLTTITTFLGLIPTAYGIGGFDPFLEPMAVSMSWGLAFATLITLFATPLLYIFISDIRTFVTKEERTAETFVTEKYVNHEFQDKLKNDIEEDLKRKFEEEIKEDLEFEMMEKINKEKSVRQKTAKKTAPSKKKK